MARGRKPRNWIKIDCDGILRGSINYLLPLDGQAIWVKMIAYSEICGGRAGFIEDNNHNGLPHDFIAQELHCPLKLFETVLKTMTDDKAIETNGTGSIRLVNFEHYQFGEYDRQRHYREQAKEEIDTTKKTYGEFNNVYLTDDEYAKLVSKFTEQGTKERIENISSGIASKGYRYKSHYAAILSWQRLDDKRNIHEVLKNGVQQKPSVKYQHMVKQ